MFCKKIELQNVIYFTCSFLISECNVFLHHLFFLCCEIQTFTIITELMIKGIVDQKILFTHPHVIPNL